MVDLNNDGIKDFVVVTEQGQLLAVSAQGEKVWQLWSAEIPPILYASPVFVPAGEKGLVVSAHNQGVSAVYADSGRYAWQVKMQQRFFASPVSTDGNADGVPDVIVIATDGDIYLIDSRSGEEVWSASLGESIKASPALFDVNDDGLKDLIILTEKGNLVAVDMARGRRVLTVAVSGASSFISSPVLGDITRDTLVEIVTASENGQIVTYGINRGVRRGQAVWPTFLGNDIDGEG
ncbi:MAG: PQQ-binding-like beta-propeller repeat protein [Gammaproteobacteria bacterium]|nr:PQQ-binding-like beta-propeller repeat protein [Gammaproteobacteria bacterium]